MSTVDPLELLRQLEAFGPDDIKSLPANLRTRLSAAARNVSNALESPADVISRVLISQPVEAITVRIAADINLFSKLADQTLTTSELAAATGTQPELLARVLRSLGAFGAVIEVGPGQFTSSPSYALYRDPDFEKAFGGCQDILNKIRQSLPAHLAATKYQSPTDPMDTATQFAYKTPGKGYIDTLLSDPTSAGAIGSFVVLMSVWADGFNQLSELYPVHERLATGYDQKTVMFVDVGGGLGQKAVALKKAVPDLPGRFVVQDVPEVIAQANDDPSYYNSVELTAHDFTTEQPIRGARCYYIRQCLHNWPAEKAVVILKRLADAATPGYSRILIHEIIVPEVGAGPWVVSQDFNMMSMFAVGERTEADWRVLCEKAGLTISKIYLDGHSSREGILEVEISS